MTINHTIEVHIQRIIDYKHSPSDEQLRLWVTTVFENYEHAVDINVRIVDYKESEELNEEFRHKKGPTNILSFSYPVPNGELSGDLVICAPLVYDQAEDNQLPWLQHWAHLVVHGCYHLQGHDHDTENAAKLMEPLEIAALAKLGYSNPYDDTDGEIE